MRDRGGGYYSTTPTTIPCKAQIDHSLATGGHPPCKTGVECKQLDDTLQNLMADQTQRYDWPDTAK